MSERPFICPNCKNWHTPAPRAGTCRMCDAGTHAPHNRTGVVDCHYHLESSSHSEVKMVGIVEIMEEALRVIGHSTIEKAEVAFAAAEKAEREVPEVVQWSAVMEMPGLKDATPTQRFKHIDAIRELAGDNRRPPEDVVSLERSMRICGDLADEVPSLMAEVRTAIGDVRRAVTGDLVAA